MSNSSVTSRTPRFRTTHWSLVAKAVEGSDAPETSAALEELCETYWFPIYAFLRRSDYSRADAEDLTQGFFAQLLEKGYLSQADPERGRFRTFLLAAVKNFVSHRRDFEAAQKRGGNHKTLSLDFEHAEHRYSIEPVDGWTAEAIFDRRWAFTLLDQVLRNLEQQYTECGKHDLFAQLKPAITSELPSSTYAEIAETLSTTPGAIKVAVHRLRKAYKSELVNEIATTLGNNEDIESERAILFASLLGGRN